MPDRAVDTFRVILGVMLCIALAACASRTIRFDNGKTFDPPADCQVESFGYSGDPRYGPVEDYVKCGSGHEFVSGPKEATFHVFV